MKRLSTILPAALAGACLGWTGSAAATIDGLTRTGPVADFTFVAGADRIVTPDGGNFLFWGYADAATGIPQYPGPTMIVDEGATVTVRLRNTLSQTTSIVFPGQEGVVATGGSAGLTTQEAPGDGVTEVSYTFTAKNPGTYTYYSGTRPELQIEMGLVGALVVRPASGPGRAYNSPATAFDREHLFLLTDMDPVIHNTVEDLGAAAVDLTKRFPVYWFINGRAAPDTMAKAGAPELRTQPYNSLPRMHPGEKLLMRVVGAGSDWHPFHHHGNHARVVARDGRLLESSPGAGPDLSFMVFSVPSVPGETMDAIFEWTGAKLGWDFYGHKSTDPMVAGEDPGDHGKPLPVLLPDQLSLTYGEMYSGSPFLGKKEALPPGGAGAMNANGGYFFMWHSHTEKEIVNWDIFPGGMLTMLIVEAPSVSIP